jgi:hypothetical protein
MAKKSRIIFIYRSESVNALSSKKRKKYQHKLNKALNKLMGQKVGLLLARSDESLEMLQIQM